MHSTYPLRAHMHLTLHTVHKCTFNEVQQCVLCYVGQNILSSKITHVMEVEMSEAAQPRQGWLAHLVLGHSRGYIHQLLEHHAHLRRAVGGP